MSIPVLHAKRKWSESITFKIAHYWLIYCLCYTLHQPFNGGILKQNYNPFKANLRYWVNSFLFYKLECINFIQDRTLWIHSMCLKPKSFQQVKFSIRKVRNYLELQSIAILLFYGKILQNLLSKNASPSVHFADLFFFLRLYRELHPRCKFPEMWYMYICS